MAKKGHYTVCTQDRLLISRLKQGGVPVISLRQGRYLERA
jgi:rRNA-processing protein FCF1